jgi:2,4-dienoyl-CoA reductase-like NADH-dependent reductase (Old Yellow Enzyme family)
MNLFTPIKLRKMELKNRIVLSPMQQYSAKNGVPGNWHLVHLGSRAVGGAALILTECTAVSQEGLATLSDVGIWNDEQKNTWKNIVDFVHEQDAKIGMQLWHSGGKGSLKHPNERMKPLTKEEGAWTVKSSSAHDFNGVLAEELTVAEIQALKLKFVEAALRAVDAGFDTVELHAGHGYLFHQFYSAVINKRNDEYGGSFHNRIRFLVETVQDVRKAIPQSMPLLVRISAVDYIESEDGWTLENSIALAEILKDNGVDFITASGGGFTNVSKDLVYPGYQIPFSKAIKEQTGILTGAVGMITEAKQANEIIVNSDADLVVIAREHLRDPYFAIHSAKELEIETDLPWQYKRAF